MTQGTFVFHNDNKIRTGHDEFDLIHFQLLLKYHKRRIIKSVVRMNSFCFTRDGGYFFPLKYRLLKTRAHKIQTYNMPTRLYTYHQRFHNYMICLFSIKHTHTQTSMKLQRLLTSENKGGISLKNFTLGQAISNRTNNIGITK